MGCQSTQESHQKPEFRAVDQDRNRKIPEYRAANQLIKSYQKPLPIISKIIRSILPGFRATHQLKIIKKPDFRGINQPSCQSTQKSHHKNNRISSYTSTQKLTGTNRIFLSHECHHSRFFPSISVNFNLSIHYSNR